MSEAPKGGPTEPTPLKFKVKTLQSIEAQLRKEGSNPAIEWLLGRMAELPPFESQEVPVTDGKEWRANMTPDGQVQSIEKPEGGFFRIKGIRNTVRFTQVGGANDGSWSQPIIEQATEEIQTSTGEIVNVSGIVILLKDKSGKTFLNLEQEPGLEPVKLPDKEIRPILRSPFQTSQKKLQNTVGGGPNPDKNLAAVLGEVAGAGNALDFIGGLEWVMVPTDANRIKSNVIYTTIELGDQAVANIAQKLPTGKFLTDEEIGTFTGVGMVSGHTLTAIGADYVAPQLKMAA